jgi:type VI protein secretion system component VasF
MAALSDAMMQVLLTLAVYYPFTLLALAGVMIIAYQRRKMPVWRLALILLLVLFVLFSLVAFSWHR